MTAVFDVFDSIKIILASLADTTGAIASYTVVPVGVELATLELKINFLKPVWAERLVATGRVVQRGKTIGLVGMTGLATGPHLDFRIEQKGQFLNFEKLGLPPSDPVSRKVWREFAEVREQWLPVLQKPGGLEMQATHLALNSGRAK